MWRYRAFSHITFIAQFQRCSVPEKKVSSVISKSLAFPNIGYMLMIDITHFNCSKIIIAAQNGFSFVVYVQLIERSSTEFF